MSPQNSRVRLSRLQCSRAALFRKLYPWIHPYIIQILSDAGIKNYAGLQSQLCCRINHWKCSALVNIQEARRFLFDFVKIWFASENSVGNCRKTAVHTSINYSMKRSWNVTDPWNTKYDITKFDFLNYKARLNCCSWYYKCMNDFISHFLLVFKTLSSWRQCDPIIDTRKSILYNIYNLY